MRRAGILIFDDVEVLDFCGPFEVLASAATGERGAQERLFEVVTVAPAAGMVTCRGGLLVQPHHDFATCPPLDIVVIPGGFGTRREIANPVVTDWIRAQRQAAEITAGVCTGAALMAAAGILDGERVTTHWAAIDWLRESYPALEVVDDERVIDRGPVVTSAGVSAGIDMALWLVERLHGRPVAEATARDMEYDWRS